jgi:hypothetical protein
MIGTDHDPADAMNSPAKACTSRQLAQGSAFDADSQKEHVCLEADIAGK